MRRLNLKLLAFLLVGLMVLGGGLFLLNRYQVRRAAGALLVQAKEAERQKQPDRALSLLNRYLRYEPNNLEALTRYGILLADGAGQSAPQIETALSVLDRILSRDPENPEVLRRAMQLNLRRGLYSDTLSRANELLKVKPDDAEAYQYVGRSEEFLTNYTEAEAAYRESKKLDPKEVATYALLASLLRTRLTQPEEADKVMDEMVAANDDSALAHLGRALYRLENDRTDEAATDIARAVELDPNDPDTLLGGVMVARKRSDWAEIKRLLEPALEKYPADPRFPLNLAQAEAVSGNLDRAIAVLDRGLNNTDDSDIRWALADMLIQRGDLKKGDLEKVESSDPKEPGGLLPELRDRGYNRGMIGYLEARLAMSKQQWNKARDTLKTTIPLLAPLSPEVSRRANQMLAECHKRLGDTASQYDVIRNLALNDPSSGDYKVELALALEGQGRREEALQQYRLVADKTADVRIAIGRLLIMQNLEKPPAARDWREAESSLSELVKEFPDDPRVPILRAEVLMATDQAEQARALLEQARDAHPDKFELWAALFTLAQRQNQSERLGPLLEAAEKQLGDTADLRLLKARYFATQGTPESREKLDALAADVDRFEAEDRQGLLRGLADAYLRAGDKKAALKLWMQFADLRPDLLPAQLVAFDLAIIAEDKAVQDKVIGRIKEIENESTGPFSQLAEARQFLIAARKAAADSEARKKNLEEAGNRLTVVATKRSADPRVAVGEAEIQEIKGNTNEAIDRYFEAIRLGERDLQVIRRVLQLLSNAKRYSEAQGVLARIQDQTMSSEMQRIASEISYRNDDLTRARELAEKTVADGSTDFRDHLWLGQMRFASGDFDKAEEPFLKAVELAPEDPTAIVGLVSYYVESRQLPKASEVVTNRAEKVFSVEKNPIALAECYELIGLIDKARTIYQGLLGGVVDKPDAQNLASSPVKSDDLRRLASFHLRLNRRTEAEPYLRAIIERGKAQQSGRTDDSNVVWAKSLMSVILGSDPSRASQALELVGLSADASANLASLDTQSPDDLRAKARALAVQKNPELRKQAFSFFQELAKRSPTGPDLLLLAQMYEIDNDWPAADENYRRAIQVEPSNPRLLVDYAKALLRQKKYDEIGPWLDKLDRVQPEAPLNVQLRALTYKSLGENDKAIGLLLAFSRRHPEQTLAASRVLEQMGYVTPAQNLVQQFVDANRATNPLAPLVLAEFLGRQGRTREALDICEPLWKSNALSPQVATVSVTILQGRDDPAQFRRVEAWMKAALAQKPDDLDLQASLAIFHSIEGRTAEAEALYRQILDKDSSNLVAMNNLAWLLAFRSGNTDEALQLIQRAIDQISDPTLRAALLDTRGVVHLAANRYDLAIGDLESAISIAPEAAMYFHLTRANLMADRLEAARLAWSDGQRLGLKAEVLDPLERESFSKVAAEVAAN